VQQILATSQQLGQILQSARKQAGLTQASAARLLGLSQSRLSQLEADPNALQLGQLLPMLALLGLELIVQDKPAAAKSADW